MDDFTRQMPPSDADEPTALEACLDYQRATLLMKIEGLDDEALRRTMTPSGIKLLTLVKHLTDAEWLWFRAIFMGEPVPEGKTPEGPWRIEPHETTQYIIDAYKAEVRRCRQIVANAAMDDFAKHPKYLTCNLRAIMTHMIEETARHNGHADILRELIDGVTGE